MTGLVNFRGEMWYDRVLCVYYLCMLVLHHHLACAPIVVSHVLIELLGNFFFYENLCN